MKAIIAFVFVSAFLLASVSEAVSLTIEAIRNAHKIAIMPGTFDPITGGHLAVAKLARTEGGADITILAASENPRKHPLPRVLRLEMMAGAARYLDGVLFPEKDGDLYRVFRDETLFGIVAVIRKINPTAEIDAVVGNEVGAKTSSTLLFGSSIRPQSWMVVLRKGYEGEELSALMRLWPHVMISGDLPDVSSSKIKAELLDHPEYYLAENKNKVSIAGLDPVVTRLILEGGYYQTPPPAPSSVCVGLVKEAWARVFGR